MRGQSSHQKACSSPKNSASPTSWSPQGHPPSTQAPRVLRSVRHARSAPPLTCLDAVTDETTCETTAPIAHASPDRSARLLPPTGAPPWLASAAPRPLGRQAAMTYATTQRQRLQCSTRVNGLLPEVVVGLLVDRGLGALVHQDEPHQSPLEWFQCDWTTVWPSPRHRAPHCPSRDRVEAGAAERWPWVPSWVPDWIDPAYSTPWEAPSTASVRQLCANAGEPHEWPEGPCRVSDPGHSLHGSRRPGRATMASSRRGPADTSDATTLVEPGFAPSWLTLGPDCPQMSVLPKPCGGPMPSARVVHQLAAGVRYRLEDQWRSSTTPSLLSRLLRRFLGGRLLGGRVLLCTR